MGDDLAALLPLRAFEGVMVLNQLPKPGGVHDQPYALWAVLMMLKSGYDREKAFQEKAQRAAQGR